MICEGHFFYSILDFFFHLLDLIVSWICLVDGPVEFWVGEAILLMLQFACVGFFCAYFMHYPNMNINFMFEFVVGFCWPNKKTERERVVLVDSGVY